MVLIFASAAAVVLQRSAERPARPDDAAGACAHTVQVVTARSFAPVLTALAPRLASGEDCVRLDVVVEDGRDAIRRVAELGADVWIPDDSAWTAGAADGELAEQADGGPGTVVAISPIYMVAGSDAAALLAETGGGWLGLANLVTGGSGVRLAVRDPAGSGDGLIGVGAVGEAVWEEQDMDASAEALANALPSTRTVLGQALPGSPDEVGLVAEYAVVSMLGDESSDAATTIRASTLFAGSDHAAILRYTWLPTAAAAADPSLTAPLGRLLSTLTGGAAAEALAAAGLRRPDATALPGAPDTLPELVAEPFEVLGGHHVDHVFATWYIAERRSDMLVVLDVSGSMGDAVSGGRPLIEVVAAATRSLSDLLPNDSELGIWVFGASLDPPRDYRVLLPTRPLSAAHRQRLARAMGRLAAEDTGTGLYDTILAAYRTARSNYREGIPCHLILFTDGKNGDDPGSISGADLKSALDELVDPDRPVHVTIITFGPESDAKLLAEVLEPVDGYVDPVRTAAEVRAVFIHVAAGGVHH